MEMWGRGRLYTYRYTVTTRMKLDSDESHFNVSLIVRDTKSQDSVHKPQPFWRKRRAEAESNRGPSAYQHNALPLGPAGSRIPSNDQLSASPCSGSLSAGREVVKTSQDSTFSFQSTKNKTLSVWTTVQQHHTAPHCYRNISSRSRNRNDPWKPKHTVFSLTTLVLRVLGFCRD